MDVTEFLTGNYLTAAEMKAPANVTIRCVEREMIGQGQDQQPKLVLYSNELQKGLVLNKTNLGVIAQLYGTETERWPGQALQLYSELVNFQGRMVSGIRVRGGAPVQPSAPPVQPSAAPPWTGPGQQ